MTKGLFTTHLVTVTLPKGIKDFYIIPFGCVHYGCSLHAKEEFDKFCQWACENLSNTYFIGMGDYFDMISGSERRAMLGGQLHETTVQALEAYWEDLCEDFVNKTAFAWGRLWGLVEGNHYGELSGGITTTQFTCQKYNHHLQDTPGHRVKYLGASSLIRVRVKMSGSLRYHFDIFAHHGRGAARTIGGSFNTVEQMARVADANIYLMGHDHRKGSVPDCKLQLITNNKEGKVYVGDRPILYVRTGSFLKGYIEDQSSYVVPRAYRPLQLGVVKILVKSKRNERGGTDFELEATA